MSDKMPDAYMHVCDVGSSLFHTKQLAEQKKLEWGGDVVPLFRAAPCTESRPAQPQAVGGETPEFINVEKQRLIAEHPHLKDAIERLTKCDHDKILMFADFLRNGLKPTPCAGDVGEALGNIDTNMRTEFEKWYSCCTDCPSVTRNGFGYKLMGTNISWNAWQAAWQTCYARHGYKPMGDAALVKENKDV